MVLVPTGVSLFPARGWTDVSAVYKKLVGIETGGLEIICLFF